MQADCWRYRLPITPECLLPVQGEHACDNRDIDEQDEAQPDESVFGLPQLTIRAVIPLLHPFR